MINDLYDEGRVLSCLSDICLMRSYLSVINSLNTNNAFERMMQASLLKKRDDLMLKYAYYEGESENLDSNYNLCRYVSGRLENLSSLFYYEP